MRAKTTEYHGCAGNAQHRHIHDSPAPVNFIFHARPLGLAAFLFLELQQEQLRQCKHDRRNQEQDQAQFNQCRGMQLADRFREFVGQ